MAWRSKFLQEHLACHVWHPKSILRFKSEFLSYDIHWRCKTHLFDWRFLMVTVFCACARYALEYFEENIKMWWKWFQNSSKWRCQWIWRLDEQVLSYDTRWRCKTHLFYSSFLMIQYLIKFRRFQWREYINECHSSKTHFEIANIANNIVLKRFSSNFGFPKNIRARPKFYCHQKAWIK